MTTDAYYFGRAARHRNVQNKDSTFSSSQLEMKVPATVAAVHTHDA